MRLEPEQRYGLSSLVEVDNRTAATFSPSGHFNISCVFVAEAGTRSPLCKNKYIYEMEKSI